MHILVSRKLWLNNAIKDRTNPRVPQVVNDDGPPSNQSSPYVHSLVHTLQSAGHTVSVVLPHTQRSWISKAHIVGAVVRPTYFRPGTLHRDDGTVHQRPLPPGAKGEEWVLIDGTPASCVHIGLYHFFKDRGPIDIVVSGPNYGRNTTAVFGLSSGTLGAALEAAVCQKKAVALSYAFFSRVHDPEIIASASRISVRLIEHLCRNWNQDVAVYSVNVPLVLDVDQGKILYTNMLQNHWTSGSSFREIEADDEEDENPEEHEQHIRQNERHMESNNTASSEARHTHKHFKWTPMFTDVYESVERSSPGNDGWAVQQGHISVTPLQANFMHVSGLEGELKLESTKADPAKLHVVIDYDDTYVRPLIQAALETQLSPESYAIINSTDDLPNPESPCLQFSSYEALSFDHLLAHPTTSLANAYIIRKALIRKHYLSTTARHWLLKHPQSYLKEHIIPSLELELDYAEYLDEALLEAYELRDAFRRNEGRAADEREWWILKPGMSDGGQCIRLFSTEDELRNIFEEWETGSEAGEGEDEDEHEDARNGRSQQTPRNSQGQEDHIVSQLRYFVVQPYILRPFLLPTNPHKFHIRTYVLAVGSLRVYVYKPMLALFALAPYVPPGFLDSSSTAMEIHLTNTCFQAQSERSERNEHEGNSVRSFWALPDTSDRWKNDVYEQICRVTGEIFEAAARGMMVHFQPLGNAFEIYGVDFLVDDGGKVWLLEVNAFPDFKQTGEHLMGIVAGLFEAVVNVAVKGFFVKLGLDLRRGGNEGEGEGGGVEMERVLDVDLGRR
ncbi:MAG: hypothetical protein M1816_001546 [Peltula sp. TS41687]|nr:MAG: hypothetical protein M1816_001546 [Peltula sp. TS41687]